MKNTDLFAAIGNIDDSLIERSYRFMNRPIRHIGNIRRVIIAAACVAAISVVIAASLFIADSVSSNSVTPGTETDTSTIPENNEYPDFVIERGILLEYTGANAEIDIPDTVTTISADAFVGNANVRNVTAVHLGSSVENIEPLALSPLTSLDSVEVDKDNEFFEIVDGVLLKKDGAYLFASIGEYKDYQASPIADLFDGRIRFKNYGYIETGDILIQLYVEDDPGSDYQYVSARKITAYGHTVEFGENGDFPITGNIKFQAFETGKYAVVANAYYYTGDSYIFYKDGFVHVAPPEESLDDPEAYAVQSGITFYLRDGELCYQRIPEKFQWRAYQLAGGIMELCVSRDELYRESGIAEIENGDIVYYPEKTESVSEAFDIEKEYSKWQNTNPELADVSLDEYLTENAKEHYMAN